MNELGLQLHIVILWAVAISVLPVGFITWAVAFVTIRRAKNHWYNTVDSGWFIVSVLTWVIGGITLICAVCALIPFNAKYWNLYETSGTVQSVSNRFVDASGDLTRGYLIELDNGQQMVLSDSRVLNLEGKKASFTCSYEWVYQSQDRLNCTIRSVSND